MNYKLFAMIALFFPVVACAIPTAASKTNVLTWPNSQIMMPVALQSVHTVTITNDQDGMKMFYFKFTLCPLDQMSRCVTKIDHLGLAKGQSYTHDFYVDASVIFRAVGSHPIYAKTEITGAVLNTTEDQKQLWVHY